MEFLVLCYNCNLLYKIAVTSDWWLTEVFIRISFGGSFKFFFQSSPGLKKISYIKQTQIQTILFDPDNLQNYQNILAMLVVHFSSVGLNSDSTMWIRQFFYFLYIEMTNNWRISLRLPLIGVIWQYTNIPLGGTVAWWLAVTSVSGLIPG